MNGTAKAGPQNRIIFDEIFAKIIDKSNLIWYNNNRIVTNAVNNEV